MLAPVTQNKPDDKSVQPDGGNDAILKRSATGKDLKRQSVRSGAVTVTSQAIQFGLQIGSAAILARLLPPENFGIIAMALSVTAFATVFKDMGLSTATIQRADLTHAQVSTMFWLNVAVGGILAVIVAATAPLVAGFYEKSQVLWVTVAMSTGFLIDSLGIQHSALLNREMRFRALATTQIGGNVIGIIASVLAALAGWSYWALVVRALVTSLVTSALLWGFSKWRPGRPVLDHGVRTLFHFGANVTGFNIVNYFCRNLDGVLIGRVCGAEVLGLYNRAYSLLLLPINNLRNPLNAVAFPAMSQLQNDPVRFRNYFRKYVALLAFASMPIAAFLFVCSDDAIGFLLGPKWAPASRIFRVLAVTAFIQPALSLLGLVMLSMGESKRYFRWGIISSICVVTAFGIGICWGAIGVAVAYGIVNYLLVYPALCYSFKGTALKPIDFFVAVARPACAGLAAAGTAWFLRNNAPWDGHFMALLGCGTVFLVAYGLVFWILPGGRSELKEHLSHVSHLGRGR